MVRSSLRGWGSFRIWVLTLMLTEVTLCVLGAGDLWVTGVTPLLRLLFGVAGPASWSLRSDEPVLPLKEKEYSDSNVVSSYHVAFLLKHSLGLSPFVWLQGFHKWASPYLSSFISHCSPAFSQPGQAPCSLHLIGSICHSLFMQTFSILQGSAEVQPPPSGLSCHLQALSTSAPLNSYWLTVFAKLCSLRVQDVLFGFKWSTYVGLGASFNLNSLGTEFIFTMISPPPS